ncbi:helix-turn-helix transcriptional regulator [bacterium]|nr:helix-turn-helix transcriptional regulator [bacterium]
MNDIKKLLGKRIKELRKAQGISQQQLAEVANIDQRSLSHIECGDTFPSRSLLDLAKALNIELKDLFDFEHLDVTIETMSAYIKENIDHLPKESIIAVYRMVKALR